jgi:4-amino-4-deoxy-L-arabinose transferase-like glycosyltransferase
MDELTLPLPRPVRAQSSGRPLHRESWLPRHGAVSIVTVVVLVYALVTILSMRQTSTTFDEITMPAAGARGYITGDFDLIELYHPRVMPYLYGLPLLLSRPEYPAEDRDWNAHGTNFGYASRLYFENGNDGPALAFRARLVAVTVGVALVFLIFAFVRRYYGDVPAVFAAVMTAFVPDLLAHGGISYNDVPIALAMVGAVWSVDRAASRPTLKTVIVAAGAVGLALGVKYSAVALAPIAFFVLVVAAASHGREWKSYVRRVLPLLPVAAVVVYLVLVAIYLGDFTLASFRKGLDYMMTYAARGQMVPALLLGEQRVGGVWYFFPVAFFIKTPAALHILLALAVLGFFATQTERHALLCSPLRGPVVATAIFLPMLMSSAINIGFRHALPIVPFVIVTAAVGIGRLWQAKGPRMRLTLAGLLLVHAASALSWFPHFIPYTSEYFSDRDLGFARISDSSHDWGQGLPLLREFMQEEGESAIYLSYFGTASPQAYGVNYVPLTSFFELDQQPKPAVQPRFLAISATNLSGAYVNDEFARFRHVMPYRVLGHSIFIFERTD